MKTSHVTFYIYLTFVTFSLIQKAHFQVFLAIQDKKKKNCNNEKQEFIFC